jgi:predicted nuclease of restriction endonuclease-like (RecB) superfamily
MTKKKSSEQSSDKILRALRGEFYDSIANVLRAARSNAYRAVNFVMVEAYWTIGRMIVEEEQQGKDRAEYGTYLLRHLSARLTREFGKGLNYTNLKYIRQFYLSYPIGHALRDQSSANDGSDPVSPANRDALRHESSQVPDTASAKEERILDALRRELTWTHYRLLIRVEKPEAREWYMNEAANQNWSTRALERQINSLYYERLLMSRDMTPVTEEMREKTEPLAPLPEDFIKDPYVLEFLGMPDAHQFREADLEQAIIGKLQAFMLELGKGFAFVARQQRISTETKDFFIDLVFYNFILKCFLLIDLKTSELTHEDIGKMDMYVRVFEDTVKAKDDNPTVGLILCTDKDHTVVKYSVLNESRQIFASKYRLYLPTEEELRIEIERERALAVREQRAIYEVIGV